MSPDDRTRVKDVMSAPLRTIKPDATLREAARIMYDEDISALVVAGPRAILTKTDIVGAVADGRDLDEAVVRDAMTPDVETVTPDLMMEEVAAMMTMYDIKHLPVVDDDYVGMVSSTDVTAHLSR